MLPSDIVRAMLLFVGLDSTRSLFKMFRYAVSGLNAAERSFVPEHERRKVAAAARIWIAVFAVVVLLATYAGSVLPLLLVGGLVVYGSWHNLMTRLLQHTRLADNVVDYRLNARTVYMNPVSRFIYWNMNYHIEHHMFPMVPDPIMRCRHFTRG